MIRLALCSSSELSLSSLFGLVVGGSGRGQGLVDHFLVSVLRGTALAVGPGSTG